VVVVVVVMGIGVVSAVVVATEVVEIVTGVVVDTVDTAAVVITSLIIPSPVHEVNSNPIASIDKRLIILFNFHPIFLMCAGS
jgi:hypothetical protein